MDFILYVHILMCFLQLRKVLSSMGVFGSVNCTLQSIVQVKLLAYVLNITHRSVMHIISYANVYFIAYCCAHRPRSAPKHGKVIVAGDFSRMKATSYLYRVILLKLKYKLVT